MAGNGRGAPVVAQPGSACEENAMRSMLFGPVLFLAVAAAPAALAQPPPTPVSIAAASSLRNPLEVLMADLRAKRPDLDPHLTYGASGTLLTQIEQGAPFDLFLAADSDTPARMASSGLGEGPQFHFAIGSLALWVPTSSKLGTDLERLGLRVLLDPSVVKVAIGNPSVAPYGRAAREALQSAGLMALVEPKLVFGQSVAHAAQFAHSGGAQAALLPLALVLAAPLRDDGRVWRVPTTSHRPIEHVGLVLKGGRQLAAAKIIVDLLLGPAGRERFAEAGYGLPARAENGR
jgi:molybdate transport system substrate-binding protein